MAGQCWLPEASCPTLDTSHPGCQRQAATPWLLVASCHTLDMTADISIAACCDEPQTPTHTNTSAQTAGSLTAHLGHTDFGIDAWPTCHDRSCCDRRVQKRVTVPAHNHIKACHSISCHQVIVIACSRQHVHTHSRTGCESVCAERLVRMLASRRPDLADQPAVTPHCRTPARDGYRFACSYRTCGCLTDPEEDQPMDGLHTGTHQSERGRQ